MPPVTEPSLTERILLAVEAIPAGRVMTYGDVAEYAGGKSGRTVGRVLSQDGGTVPWHRVLRADGTCAPHLFTEQRQRLIAEGVRFDGHRVDLGAYRWDGVRRLNDGLRCPSWTALSITRRRGSTGAVETVGVPCWDRPVIAP